MNSTKENRSMSIAASAISRKLEDELSSADNRDLLIYLHIPFCSYKCTFCDWVNTIPSKSLRSGESTREKYAEALCRQIEAVAPQLNRLGYIPRAIYWGGGTPTKLEADSFEKVVQALQRSFNLNLVGEHTIEASPETLTQKKLDTLARLGANRLSIGAQSMDNAELLRIGRNYSEGAVADGVDMARQAGFRNINLDLIIAFPEQKLASVIDTVEKTLRLSPEHITVYIYRPTPNTVMAEQISSGKKKGATLKQMLDAYNATKALLEDDGYSEYSFGYFSREPKDIFNGEKYYFDLLGDYIGFGSGARSILSHHMIYNESTNLTRFIQDPVVFDNHQRFTPTYLDNILPSLRLTIQTKNGVNFQRFKRLFGFEFNEIESLPMVKSLIDYLTWCGSKFVRTTEAIAVTEESLRRSYIMSLLGAYSPLKAKTEKLQEDTVKIIDSVIL